MKKCVVAGFILFLAITNIFARTKIAYPLATKGSISSGFGWRTHPATGDREWHTGVDIAVPKRTEVRVVADGRVIYTGWLSNYGWSIKIEHVNGIVSTYAHLSQILVREGTYVYTKQKIGLSGNSGLSTGAHLHFSVSKDREYIDPLPVLKVSREVKAGPVGGGIIKIRKRINKVELASETRAQIRKNLCRAIEIYSVILVEKIPEIIWEGAK